MKKLLVIALLVASVFAAEKAPWHSVFPQQDLSGNKIVYDKKAYLVDVWATWCPPCRQTIPELIALQQEVSQNAFVLGLSVDQESPEYVAKFIKQEKVNYPVAMADNKVMKYFPAVRGIPTMFVLDKNGKIVKTFVGYADKKALAAAIKKVIDSEVH
jgi:thiol-disulfide isomerase/thioredoxin